MWARPATSTFPSTVAPAGPTAAPAPWQVWLSHCGLGGGVTWLIRHLLLKSDTFTSSSRRCDRKWLSRLSFLHEKLCPVFLLSRQTASTSCGKERGHLPTSLSSTWSTAVTPAVAMEAITAAFGSTQANTGSRMRPAITTRLKTRVSVTKWWLQSP